MIERLRFARGPLSDLELAVLPNGRRNGRLAAKIEPDSAARTHSVMEVADRIETVEEARDMVAHVLAGVAGGAESTWRKLIGPIARAPTWQHVRYNWIVQPSGTVDQREWIMKAVEVARAEHPYVL